MQWRCAIQCSAAAWCLNVRGIALRQHYLYVNPPMYCIFYAYMLDSLIHKHCHGITRW